MSNKKQYTKKFELEEGRGNLFKNSFKDLENEKDAKKPDYTGEIKIKGELVKLSLWKATTKNGDIYLKLSVYQPEGGAKPTNETLSSEDLPF